MSVFIGSKHEHDNDKASSKIFVRLSNHCSIALVDDRHFYKNQNIISLHIHNAINFVSDKQALNVSDLLR